MRRIAVAIVLALAAPASAEARVHTIAPPGNSSVGQYVETVPTAGGGQPTNTVHPTGGAVGRPGGPGGTPRGGAGGPISASTQHALAEQGPAGVAAAALAEATAPQISRSPSHARDTGPSSSVSAASTGGGSSPATSVFKAVSGSTGEGGLGPLRPALLIGSVLAAAGLALMRRRRTS